MNCILVGTGFGAVHSRWLHEVSGVHIGALIYKSDRQQAQRLQADHDIGVISTDAKATLGQTKFDLMAIVSPPDTHLEYLRLAVDAGIPVVVDKPLAENLSSATMMRAVSHESAEPVFTFFQWRLHPAALRLREICVAGRLGSLSHIDAQFEHDFLAGNITTSLWRHGIETAGAGSLGDMGVHLFDLLRFVTGRDWAVTRASLGLAHPRRESLQGLIACTADDFADVHLASPTCGMTGRVLTNRAALGSRRLSLRVFGKAGAAGATFDPETGAATLILSPDGAATETERTRAGSFNPYRPIIATLRGTDTQGAIPACIEDGFAAQSMMGAALSAASCPS
jgi:predicted dehydrogenase